MTRAANTPPDKPGARRSAKSFLRRILAPLRVRLLCLVLLAWVPVVGLVVVSSFKDRAKAVARTKQDLLRVVHTVSGRQQEHIYTTRQLLRALSRFKEIVPLSPSQQGSLFAELLSLQKAYTEIGITDTHGLAIVGGGGKTNTVNYANRTFFISALKAQKFVDHHYEFDQPSRKAVLYMANPVFDQERSIKAVAFAALNLDWINRFAARVDLLENFTLSVFDNEGYLLLRYPDSERRERNESLREMPELAQLLNQVRDGSGTALGSDQVENIFSFTALSSTGGFPDAWVIASIPASNVHADAYLVLAQNLTFLGFIGVLALGAAWFGGDVFVLQPVNTLAKATHSVRSGDFDVRLQIKHAPEELVELAQDFSGMAATLKQRITEREHAEAELRKLNEELEQRVEARTRELKRSNEELEQFAYVASHDLQEPLRMVTSYMQLLRQRYEDKLDENAHDFIGFAVDGAERMHRLINDLLTFSRVGTRQRPFEPIAISEVLEQVKSNLTVAIEESGSIITNDPLPVVQGDSMQLSQLLQNLVGNAIKFRGPRHPAIQISARRVLDPKAHSLGEAGGWEFCVRDNGIGIDAENFQRIFVIFQRLHGRDKYPGSGMGLAICKKIVERHGGQIWLESEPKQGTCFYFTLPAANDSSAGDV